MDVEIKQCDPIRIVAIRHIGPYMEIGKAFEKVAHYGHTHNLFEPGLQIVGVYHDDPDDKPAYGLRADAGFSVTKDPAHLAERFHMVDVPGGRYASAIHEGHYSSLGETYGAIRTFVGEHGYEMDERPCYEVYLNSAQETAPEDLRTEVRVPVR